MRKIDYHLHTYFSADSKAKPEEYILKAIEEGLEEICFTDHHDCLDGWRLNYEPYFQELLPLKEKYKDQIELIPVQYVGQMIKALNLRGQN